MLSNFQLRYVCPACLATEACKLLYSHFFHIHTLALYVLARKLYHVDMEHISSLFKKYEVAPKSRRTERGDLLEYFSKKTGKPIPYIAMRLTGIPTHDLYHIQKQCDQYKGPWGKAFFGMLKRPVDNSDEF